MKDRDLVLTGVEVEDFPEEEEEVRNQALLEVELAVNVEERRVKEERTAEMIEEQDRKRREEIRLDREDSTRRWREEGLELAACNHAMK